MAFSSTTGWGVDPSAGSDAFGGGFDPASSGTNYANQSSPQVTYTDLVIDASTSTKITSAGNPFTSLHVGNIINITSGTGFTVQRVQVVSVAAGVATCDKSVGSTSSSGGHGVLGGSLQTITEAQTLSVAGNTINIKSSATITLTTGLTVPNADMFYVGYASTWGDYGTKPLITTATNSTNIFTDTAVSAANTSLINLSLSTTAGTPGYGVVAISRAWTGLTISHCKFSGFNVAIFGDDSALVFYINNCSVYASEFTSITTTVFGCTVCAFGCYLHSSSAADGYAVTHSVETSQVTQIIRCIINGLNHGINSNIAGGSAVQIYECTIYGCASDGILASGTFHSYALAIVNNILYSNGGYGVNASSSNAELYPAVNFNNAYGANTSGARNGLPAGTNDVALSANPFTNASSGDFSLNSTSGGGAACKGAGFPGVFPAGTSTGNNDIGAVQSAGGGGGTTIYVVNQNTTRFIQEGA